MSSIPADITFVDRHSTLMDLMKGLKAYLVLPSAELTNTAKEIEEACANSAGSRDEYLQLIRSRKEELASHSSPTGQSAVVATTTGVADRPGAEVQDVGKYRAVYHERSLNAVVYKIVASSSSSLSGGDEALKIVALDGQVAPHDIRREAKFLQMLSGYPNIVQMISAESLAGGLYGLRLPFLRYDLGTLAASDGQVLNILQRKAHLRDLFSALAAVHEAGIIHRDIKPSNILLGRPDGPAILIDFGISWSKELNGKDDEPEDKKITDVGTGPYRPPELLFGCKNYGFELDAWAAGCTIAEVLIGSGKPLFDAGAVTREDFLGSDLTLLNSIFRKLGTPTEETWPEARIFRDWGKIQFKEFPAVPWSEMLPRVDDNAIDLISRLVVYSGGQRLSAKQVSHRNNGCRQKSPSEFLPTSVTDMKDDRYFNMVISPLTVEKRCARL